MLKSPRNRSKRQNLKTKKKSSKQKLQKILKTKYYNQKLQKKSGIKKVFL